MRIIRKFSFALLALMGAITLAYLLGPRPEPFHPNGTLPTIPLSLTELETRIIASEAAVTGLKPDNEARIVWADPGNKKRTPFSIVYLHGFGASQGEGMPVHTALASRLGCNLYLSRLQDQGIEDDNAFKDMTAATYLASAREAVARGKVIGDQVILMGTSTGASLALYLAYENPEVAAVLAYSPIIDTADGNLFIARGPWGRQLVSVIKGNPDIVERPETLARYWSRTYHPDAYVALSVLVGETMIPEVFKVITCPVFLGYYYKNEKEQDSVVSVSKMLTMFDQLGTPADLKHKQAFPEAGAHVIASSWSSADWKGVLQASDQFLHDVLILD